MAYTNFTNCTAEEYKNIMYSQETKNKIKILFNNVELQDADEYCESFEVTSRIIPTGSKVFMLSNLVSKEATLILHNIDTNIIQDQVSISIGTLVSENTYEYVPIGIFNIQEKPTTDKDKTTIKLRDNTVKLDFDYNAKPLIDSHGGSATKKQILDDICSQAGITNNVSTFLGSGDLIGIYDNTIRARQYVSWLAEQAGAVPVITRTGALDFVYLNNLTTNTIPIEIVEKYENGDNFKISRVVYEDAIRKYESGNETYDTLFLDSANPYVSSQSQVDSIKNIVNNFEINSYETGRVLGNPAIDHYDLIQIEDKGKNLFDMSSSTTKKYINYSNGVVSNSDDWSASDYIKIQPDTTYTLSGITNSGWAAGTSFYDSNKTFILSVYSTIYTFTTPNNAKYVRLSVKSETPTSVMFNEGTTALPYEPYYDNTFTTFANNVLRYNGKLTHTFDSKISLERKTENVTKNSNQTFKNFAKTSIDNLNAEITIQAGRVDEIENELQNPTSTKEGKSIDITDAAEKPLLDFKMYGDTQQDTAILPSEYQQVEYIESTGTQHIDTGFKPNQNTRTIISYYNNNDSTHFIFGGRDSFNNNNYGLVNLGTSIRSDYCGNDILTHTFNPFDIGDKIIYDKNKNVDTVYENGTLFGTYTFNTQTITTNHNMYLFTTNDNGNPNASKSKIRLYYCKIYDNATLVRDFIPCYRKSDNVIGLYDLVNNTFYTNAGTGTFIKGNNVTLPTPDYPQEVKTVTGNQEINVTGKNLLGLSLATIKSLNTSGTWSNNVYTLNNITFTINDDFTIKVNGTANANTTLTLTSQITNSYNSKTLNGCPSGGSANTYRLYCDLENEQGQYITNLNDFGSGVSIDTSPKVQFYILVKSGTNASNLIFKPMVSTNGGDYEPYKSFTQEINLGKNLINYNDFTTYGTTTITDETISVANNTASTISGISLILTGTLKAGKYTFTSYSASNGGLFVMHNSSDYSHNVLSGGSYTFNYDGTSYLRILGGNINAGDTKIYQMQLEKGTQATSYSEYFEPIELCKIGDYQDYIYKDNGSWYLHKEIGKVVLDGTQSTSDMIINTSSTNTTRVFFNNVLDSNSLQGYGLCEKLNYQNVWNPDNEGFYYDNNSTAVIFRMNKTTIGTSTSEVNTYFTNNNTAFYYVLATSTNTIIPDTVLIEQLETLMSIPLFKGVNHITVDTLNLEPYLYIEYLRDTTLNEHFVPNEELGKYYTKVETDAKIQVTSDSIEENVSRSISNLSSEEQTHYQEMLSKMDDKASISDIETVTTQVNTLQTDTYTKTEINKILNGTDENGNVVSFLQTLSATLDDNGMTYRKSGAKTSSNINETGLKVYEGDTMSKELLFAGYDTQRLEALVRVANLYLTQFLGLDVWRVEIINDSTNGKGLGFFYIG